MTWVYRQLFHDPRPDGSGTDTLLAHLVSPAVVELGGRGAINRFFFLRYFEDGHHVRLRLRVADGTDPATVASKVDALAVEHPLVTRVAAAEYEPELQKHGGPIGQEIAERQFCSSSRLALGCIGRTILQPRSRWIVAAWALERMLGCAGIEGRERRSFLQAYADHWRALARAMTGADVPAFAPDNEAAATVRALCDDQECVNTLVDDASGFVIELERDLGELVAADRSAKLDTAPAAIVANLLHTNHNRLGLSIVEEARLASLIAATEPGDRRRGAAPLPAAPQVAVTRLIQQAQRRHAEIALVDGADAAVLGSLTEAAAAASLRTVRARPGDITVPFAPLQALADAHPAGARLRLALRRLEHGADDRHCPLPPDASAVGDALRTFLVAETNVPTLLILPLGAADADTLHAVLFVARSIEDLPLALVLLADGPRRASWQSFVKELTDGPGFVHIGGDGGLAEAADSAVPLSVGRATRFVRAGALSEGASLLTDALARAPLGPADRAETLVVLAQALLRSSRPALARRALDTAATLGVPAGREAFARRLRLAALHGLGDFAGLEALHEGVAADAARIVQSSVEQSWALLDAALASASPARQAEHEAYLDALLSRPVAAVPQQCLLAAHAWRAAAHVARAEFDRALAHQRLALACAERVGDFSRALFLRARLAASAAAQGFLGEAEELFGATAEAAMWAGVHDLAALAAQHTITLALARGDDSPASRWLLAPRPTRGAVWRSGYGRPAALYLHAKLLSATGELQAARSVNEQLRAHLAGLPHPRPDNADFLEIAMERLNVDVARAGGDAAAHRAAERNAAELERQLQPFEQRLVGALTRFPEVASTGNHGDHREHRGKVSVSSVRSVALSTNKAQTLSPARPSATPPELEE